MWFVYCSLGPKLLPYFPTAIGSTSSPWAPKIIPDNFLHRLGGMFLAPQHLQQPRITYLFPCPLTVVKDPALFTVVFSVSSPRLQDVQQIAEMRSAPSAQHKVCWAQRSPVSGVSLVGPGRVCSGPSTAGSFWPNSRLGESHYCPLCLPIPTSAWPHGAQRFLKCYPQAGRARLGSQDPRLKFEDQR